MTSNHNCPIPKVPCDDIQDQDFNTQLGVRLAGQRFPYSGQWELTYRCNLKCMMCYTDCMNTPEAIRRELEYSEVIRILDELYEAGCLYLCFTGGEPLCRPDFLDIYTYAKKKGFLLTIFTNGTLITPKIAEYWARYRPYMIEISFHGNTKTSFDQITQKENSYEKCLSGIRLILERELPLRLKSLGMTLNQHEILEIKKKVDALGDRVQYKFSSDLRENLDQTTSPLQFQLPSNVIAEIEQKDDAMREERERQEHIDSEYDLDCGGGRYKFHIDAYGGLQLCSLNRRRSYDLRKGSFREGFYAYLPDFPCPSRKKTRTTFPIKALAYGHHA